jgi:hypothetical protein
MATQTIECGAACSITVELAPAPPTSDNIADIGLVFGLFFGAVLGVFLLRQFLKYFEATPHDH